MTKPHPAHLAFTGLLMLLSGLPLASRAGEPLIVVEDRGGTSALPYYEALNLQPRANAPARPSIPTPQVPATRADEAAMLPVRSAKLTPGTVARRVIEAPGLRPFVVIGDDEASRAWLQRRAAALRERGAVGLVVNVETAQGLARLRALVPGVPLAPVAGDDLADRPGPAALPGADHGHRHRAMKPCRANSRSRFCYAQRWSYTPSRRVQAPRFCAWWPHGRSR
ncbi:integrating conjugative element protein [Pseudomonas aeruginosa]|nr:integrating conjugative element protein [Pseudomonas aeruginosa]